MSRYDDYREYVLRPRRRESRDDYSSRPVRVERVYPRASGYYDRRDSSSRNARHGAEGLRFGLAPRHVQRERIVADNSARSFDRAPRRSSTLPVRFDDDMRILDDERIVPEPKPIVVEEVQRDFPPPRFPSPSPPPVRGGYRPAHGQSDDDSSSHGDYDSTSDEGPRTRRRRRISRREREERTSRSRYYDRDRYTSSTEYSETTDSEDDENRDAYSFSLSRHTRSLFSRDSTLGGSVSDISEKDSITAAVQAEVSAPGPKSKPGKIQNVICSQYTGEGSIGGFQTAQLTVIQDVGQASKKGPVPVFRWVHFEDPNMSLDEFQTGVSDITALSSVEKEGISKLFTKVRKRYDKPIQISGGAKPSKAMYMAPGTLQEALSKESRQKATKERTVTWMCLPYFSLEQYSGIKTASRPSSHPVRTLLQAKFSLVKKERDMQQAVCNLPDTPAGQCFHIAQVWCLVLDDSLLVTCSRTSTKSLCGESISIVSGPSPANPGTRSVNILVSGGKFLLWSLPLDGCLTWFHFLSHFWEYWPKKIQFTYNGKPISADNWPRVIAHAKKGVVRLYLETRPRVKEPAKGILLEAEGSTLPEDKATGKTKDISKEASSDQSAQDYLSSSSPGETASKAAASPDAGGGVQVPVGPSLSTPEGRARTPRGSPKHGPFVKDTYPPTIDLSDGFHVFTWLNMEEPMIATTAGSRSLSPDPSGARSGRKMVVTINEEDLYADLEEMDRFLAQKTGLIERLAYKECRPRTRSEVYDLIFKEGKDITGSKTKDEKKRKGYENKVEIVNKTESLFQFFLPCKFEGPTVGKFWGAVYQLLVSLSPKKAKDRYDSNLPVDDDYGYGRSRSRRHNDRDRERDLTEMVQAFDEVYRNTQLFKEVFSQATVSDRPNIELPEEFPKAWLHLLMSLMFSSKEKQAPVFEEQFEIFFKLLNDGMRKVVQGMTKHSLLESSVFMPVELAYLINFHLLGDFTANSLDISDTYLEYLSALESAVEANPLDRGHQDKLTRFKQEVFVISQTLRQQRRIVDSPQLTDYSANRSIPLETHRMSFNSRERSNIHRTSSRTIQPVNEHGYSRSRSYRRDAYYDEYDDDDNFLQPIVIENIGPPRAPGSQLDPTDPSGVKDILVGDSLALIDRKMREFQEMNERASELETWNMQMIDSNKDRQETALYAFTIVTIVFLPLSTVAGILGMNVDDIRNMNQKQWVFWATALPLTAIIITLCLIWAGELDNFLKGFRNLWKSNKEKKMYFRPGDDEPYSTEDAKADLGRVIRFAADRDRERERSPPPRAGPFYTRRSSRPQHGW